MTERVAELRAATQKVSTLKDNHTRIVSWADTAGDGRNDLRNGIGHRHNAQDGDRLKKRLSSVLLSHCRRRPRRGPQGSARMALPSFGTQFCPNICLTTPKVAPKKRARQRLLLSHLNEADAIS